MKEKLNQNEKKWKKKKKKKKWKKKNQPKNKISLFLSFKKNRF